MVKEFALNTIIEFGIERNEICQRELISRLLAQRIQ